MHWSVKTVRVTLAVAVTVVVVGVMFAIAINVNNMPRVACSTGAPAFKHCVNLFGWVASEEVLTVWMLVVGIVIPAVGLWLLTRSLDAALPDSPRQPEGAVESSTAQTGSVLGETKLQSSDDAEVA